MIIVKNSAEIDIMRKSGEILFRLLQMLEEAVKPGISTRALNSMAEDFIKKNNSKPSFKGYGGFPAAICTSVNEQLLHGIPSHSKILHEGDIISIDAGVLYNGYNTDAARTIPVGDISDDNKRLIDVTRQSFFEGVVAVKSGLRLHDISSKIQDYIEGAGYQVVTSYVGHGVGRDLHEDPNVPNYGRLGTGVRLRSGMTLAIEPMVTVLDPEVRVLDDGWTVVACDGKNCAHYENTVVVTDNGPENLTWKC